MSICKSCGMSIAWVKTRSGKWMPVETVKVPVLPGKGKETFITDDGDIITGERYREFKKNPDTVAGNVPHWANCPGADRHRRRGKDAGM
ncbi:MAG: hypothetical protein LUE89_00060 [Clostridiales bacterium]|nr:hypothetical protein [Clostridiales bacterium]